MEMPAELVDVNVHPAKTEVRFARENDVFDAVYHAVKLALTQPGSGERLFRFDTAENSGQKSDEISSEFDEKQSPFTGLSAVLAGQSAPGTLQQNGRPAAPAGAPGFAAGDAPALGTAKRAVQPAAGGALGGGPPGSVAALLPLPAAPRRSPAVTVVAADVPVTARAALHSPGAFDAASENERLLDIRPDDADAQRPAAAPDVQKLAECAAAPEPPCNAPQTPEQTMLWAEDGPPPLQYVGEVFRTYLIAQRGDELCLIDKHAAPERMLYEQLAAEYGAVDSQMLLAPVPVELSAEEKHALLENAELLENVGLELDDFGGSTVLVRAVPCDVEIADVADLTVELAAKLAAGSRDALNEQTEWVLHSIACRAAIKAGDCTPPEHLLHLAEAILSGQVPPFCPHGRPCVLKLTKKELEKQFGRIV